MELKTFVKSALTDIVEAVAESQMELIGKRAMINPKVAPPTEHSDATQQLHMVRTQAGLDYYKIPSIEFDVAVTVTDTTTTGGGGKISVLALSLGGEMKDQMQTTSVSRIRFQVPILYPK